MTKQPDDTDIDVPYPKIDQPLVLESETEYLTGRDIIAYGKRLEMLECQDVPIVITTFTNDRDKHYTRLQTKARF